LKKKERFPSDLFFEQLHPLLLSIDTVRNQVFRKFQPIMAVFAVYLFITFMFPYVDLGVPRQFRGNVFYFLLLAGGVGFFVVFVIYFRQMQEVLADCNLRWSKALGSNGPEWGYSEREVNLDALLRLSALFSSFDEYDGQSMVTFSEDDTLGITQLDVKLTDRTEEPLPKENDVFEGKICILTFQQVLLATPLKLEFERKWSVEGLKAVLNDEERQKAKNVSSGVVLMLEAMAQEIVDSRRLAEPPAFWFYQNMLFVRIEHSFRFTDVLNWEPWDNEAFVASRLQIWNSLYELSELIKENGAANH